jgi:predicted N-formylglutamate amidohydrolase
MISKGQPEPVHIRPSKGLSPWVFVCEHAVNLIPESLGSLGLGETDLTRHIAWDIGVTGVAEFLATHLDATLITQPYSRLVIDCNRRPDDPELVAKESDGTIIPGNQSLGVDQIQSRLDGIYAPFHECIEGELDKRQKADQKTILVSLHSFTPALAGGETRPWHIGVIYNRERRLADALLKILGRRDDIVLGDNQPFAMTDDNVFTLPHHGEHRGIPTVEIELRQDLIGDEKGQLQWARILADTLGQALNEIVEGAP